MRLINGDMLWKNVIKKHETFIALEDLYEEISNVEPINAEQVVHCKDCKNCEVDGLWLHCHFHNIYMQDDDYCSRGFRRIGK